MQRAPAKREREVFLSGTTKGDNMWRRKGKGVGDVEGTERLRGHRGGGQITFEINI